MAGHRENAGDRLKRIQASDSQDFLVAALTDPSNLVVEAAARRITSPKAAEPLLQAYGRLQRDAPGSDHGCWARMAIVEALGRLQAAEGEEAARVAIRTVQVERVGTDLMDTATGLRAAAAGLLANLHAPEALLDLAWLLFDAAPNAPAAASEAPYSKLATRVAAARAIGALADASGAAVLNLKLAFPGGELPEVLVECMDALVALKAPRLQELLTPMLARPDPYVVAGAATALAAGCGAAAVPVLVDALDRVVADAREPLVYALASVRAEAAATALKGLSHHPEPKVSRLAKELSGEPI